MAITMAFGEVNKALAVRFSFPSRRNSGFPAEDDGLREALSGQVKTFDARDPNYPDDDDNFEMKIPLGHRDNLARITKNLLLQSSGCSRNCRILSQYIRRHRRKLRLETLFGVPLHTTESVLFSSDRRRGIFGLLNFEFSTGFRLRVYIGIQ